jgi:hypothetical protein
MVRRPQFARVRRAWRLAQHCHTRSLRARDVLEIERAAAPRVAVVYEASSRPGTTGQFAGGHADSFYSWQT